jgi:hypothetical protein
MTAETPLELGGDRPPQRLKQQDNCINHLHFVLIAVMSRLEVIPDHIEKWPAGDEEQAVQSTFLVPRALGNMGARLGFNRR